MEGSEVGQCVSTCQGSYFLKDEIRKCVKCHATCKTCLDAGRANCTNCSAGQYLSVAQERLDMGSCDPGCGEGFARYTDLNAISTKKCRACYTRADTNTHPFAFTYNITQRQPSQIELWLTFTQELSDSSLQEILQQETINVEFQGLRQNTDYTVSVSHASSQSIQVNILQIQPMVHSTSGEFAV